jgi:UDP-N-acetylglucosamine--N-acetylmuramyl-(pentapeptide) pyrophosphoryl-undecaprenol N-acetylglucosamine transferase
MMENCIVIGSGGTGGHLYPTIAVAEEIRKERPDIRIVFIGTPERIEAREVPRAGFEFFPIRIQAPGKSIGSVVRFPFQYLRASRNAKQLLHKLSPSAFLGGGAYLSVPIAFAAKSKQVPVALLEINAVPGRANKILASAAEKVFVAYPEAVQGFSKAYTQKIEVVGTPVRISLANSSQDQQEARKYFGLRQEHKTLLVFGGSLGARSINEAMAEHANGFLEQGYNIIWQTGKSADLDQLQNRFTDRSSIAIFEYINEMDKAYAASDLVVSRAGASTLAELATLGKTAILVPYPLAIRNHQEHNARAFERADAAIVVTDDRLKEQLGEVVNNLMDNDSERLHMSEKIRNRENKEARKVVAQWLIARCTS